MKQIVAYIHVSDKNELLFDPNNINYCYIRDNLKTLAEMNEDGYELMLMYDYSHLTNPCDYNDKGYTKKLAIFNKVE